MAIKNENIYTYFGKPSALSSKDNHVSTQAVLKVWSEDPEDPEDLLYDFIM